MKFKPTEDQFEAACEFLTAQEKLDHAEQTLTSSFSDVQKFIDDGRFDDAREYLRNMPECASKVLFFRSIIVAESDANQDVEGVIDDYRFEEFYS